VNTQIIRGIRVITVYPGTQISCRKIDMISLIPRPLPPPEEWPGAHCLHVHLISQVFMGFIK